jgi:hypothetical protein
LASSHGARIQTSRKLELERKIANYRDLMREFPDGQIAEVIRDFIEELERELRSLKKARPPQVVASAILPLPPQASHFTG